MPPVRPPAVLRGVSAALRRSGRAGEGFSAAWSGTRGPSARALAAGRGPRGAAPPRHPAHARLPVAPLGIERLALHPAPAAFSPGSVPIVYHPAYSAPRLVTPSGQPHRFPMQVFGALFRQLVASGVAQPGATFVPERLPTREMLLLAHCPGYVDALADGTLPADKVRRIGFHGAVFSDALLERSLAEVAGTLLTARLALRFGLACHVAGGTHHAHFDAGSGFCVLNDFAVAVRTLQRTGEARRVAILDLDVHQGDGNAALFHGDPSVLTVSVHAQSNFPYRKSPGDLDIGLPDGAGDDELLAAARRALGAVREFAPDLVFYDAGVDVHAADALGRLRVTDAGLARRESLVLDSLLAQGLPVCAHVGGGYDADLEVLAARHAVLHAAAGEMWRDYGVGAPRAGAAPGAVPRPVGSWSGIQAWEGLDMFGAERAA